MSQQAEGVLTISELLDSLVRSQVIVSKSGYSCDGTDLYAFPNSDDLPTTGLNDELNTEAFADDISSVTSAAIKTRNNAGTAGSTIKAPNDATQPLNTFGLRISETGSTNFVYDAPTILSSDWSAPEQAKMVDRVFTTNPAILKIDNNESGETIFDFGSVASKTITAKFSADIVSGTPNLTYDILKSSDNETYTSINSGSLTDGVSVLIQETDTFQFIKILLTAEDEDTFSVNLNIFEAFELLSPTITSSDWSSTGNMIDGDFTTNNTQQTTGGAETSELVADFGSIATRRVVIKAEVVTNSGTSTNDYLIEISNDNVSYSTLASGSIGGATLLNPASASFRYVRFTIFSSSLSSFDVDHNVFEIYQMVTPGIEDQTFGWNNAGNSVDGSLGTFTDNSVFTQDSIDYDTGSISSKKIGCRFQAIVVSGSPNFVIRTSDTTSGFVTVSTTALTTGVIEDLLLSASSFRYFQLEFTSNASNYTGRIFEAFTAISPTSITSSDWASTTSMDDNNLTTFNTNNLTGPSGILSTVTDFGTIATRIPNTRIQADIISGTPTLSYELAISNDNSSYSIVDSGSLTDGDITDISGGSQSFRYVRVTMAPTVNAGTVDETIFEIYVPISPVIPSSDWVSTGNMIDGDLDTFETLNVSNPDSTVQTIVNFGSIASRTPHTLLRPITISGTPAYPYVVTTSTDNVTYVSYDSGNLSDGITTDSTSGAVTLQYLKIEMTGTATGTFESDMEIFEVYDGDVVNGLDFTTVVVGGSSSNGGIVNQSDPLTFQIVDGDEQFHRPRYFLLEQNKNLSVDVTALRTGQTIQTDRGMTWQRNFS